VCPPDTETSRASTSSGKIGKYKYETVEDVEIEMKIRGDEEIAKKPPPTSGIHRQKGVMQDERPTKLTYGFEEVLEHPIFDKWMRKADGAKKNDKSSKEEHRKDK
jgi:hypothetical protein